MNAGLLNNIEAMNSLSNEIEKRRKDAINYHNVFMSYIRECRDNGYLEEENYEQLMHLYLGNYFDADFDSAFGDSTNKMINYLTSLRDKVLEYMNISG